MSKQPDQQPSFGGVLWRIAELLLGEKLSQEVLGDLIQESGEVAEKAKRQADGLRSKVERRYWLLKVSLFAIGLALAIRGRETLASLRDARVAFHSHPRDAILLCLGRLRRSALGGLAMVRQELAQAFRRICRAPLYALFAMASVSVAVAGAVAIFSVVHGVLLRPLPYVHPEDLVAVFTSERDGAELRNPTSPADFLDWREATSDLATLTAATYWSPGLEVPALGSESDVSSESSSAVKKIVGLRVTPGLLGMLGVKPLLGRVFDPRFQPLGESHEEGRPDTVVISWGTWQDRLGGVNEIIGSELFLEGKPHVVIGVMPQEFSFPPFWATDAELWAPFDPGSDPARDARFLRVFARLAPDVSLDVLEQRLQHAHRRLVDTYAASHTGTSVRVEPLREPMVSGTRPVLLLLAAGAVLLLALMATNLAALLLAKGVERRGMIATQLALGASRGRLVFGFVSESVLLAIGGTMGGTLLASLTVGSSRLLGAGSAPWMKDIEIEPATWLVASVVMIALGLVIGLIPGLRLLAETEGNASANQRAPKTETSRRALVIAEIALTTCLLLMAGLVTRSFQRLKAQDLGFEIARVATLDIDMAQALGGDGDAPGAVASKLQLLVDEISRQPGVAHAGAVNHLPLVGDLWRGKVFSPGSSAPDDDVRAALRVASPGYFDAMSMRLHKGRFLTARDRKAGEPVVVINRALAATLWPDEDAVGKVIAHNSLDDDAPRSRVVGVVENLKQSSLEEMPPPEIYYPFAQNPFPWAANATLAVRSSHGPGFDLGGLVAIVSETLPGVAVGSATTLEEIVAHEFGGQRARTLVLLLFAGIATLLAATGVFGMVAFSTQQRRHEFGLRTALGSGRIELVWLVLREAVLVAIAGMVMGGLAALTLDSWTKSILFETSIFDGMVWVIVALVVTMLTLAACTVPAIRASNIHPARALDRL